MQATRFAERALDGRLATTAAMTVPATLTEGGELR
jgi:hypothetical protein